MRYDKKADNSGLTPCNRRPPASTSHGTELLALARRSAHSSSSTTSSTQRWNERWTIVAEARRQAIPLAARTQPEDDAVLERGSRIAKEGP